MAGTQATFIAPPSLSSRNEWHLTALIQAAANGELVQVIMLLSEGQNVNARDSLSCTALTYAVRGGYELIVERLLQKGAEVDCQDNWLWTPLMYAAHAGHEKIVHKLLDKEANYLLRNASGLTAAQIALQSGHVQLGDLLHRHEMGAAEVATTNQALGPVTTTSSTAAVTTTTTCTAVTTVTSTSTQPIASTAPSTPAAESTSSVPGAPAPPAPALSAQDYAVGMLGLVGGAVQVAGGVAATLYSGPTGASLGPALVSSGTSSLIYTARTLLYQGKALDMDTYIKEAGIGAVTGMVMPNLSKAGGVAIGWVKANDVLAAGIEVVGKGIEAVGAQGAKLLGGTVVQAANTLGQGAVQGTAGNLVNSVTSAAVYWSESDDQQKQALKRRVKDSVSVAAVLKSASVVGMGAIIQQAGAAGSAAVSRLGPSLPEQAGQLQSQLAEQTPTAWDYVRNAMAAGGKAVATDTGMAGASKLAENVWNEGSLAGASEGVADSMAEAAKESLVSSAISGTSQAVIGTFKTSRRQQLLREMQQSQLEEQARIKDINLATEEQVNRWKATQEAKRQLEEAQDIAAIRQLDLLAAEAVLKVRLESVLRAGKKVEKLGKKLEQAQQARLNAPDGGLASTLRHDQNMRDCLSRFEEGLRQWKALKKECEQHRTSVFARAKDDFQLSQQGVMEARQTLENESMKAAPPSAEPFHRAIEAHKKSSTLARQLDSLDSNGDPISTPPRTPHRPESQGNGSATFQLSQGTDLESWHVVALAVATLDQGAGASGNSSNSSRTPITIHFPPQAWLAEAQRSGTHLNQLALKQGWLVQGNWVMDRNRDDALQLRTQMPDLMAACGEYAQHNLQLLAASGVISTGEDRLVHAWLAQTLGAARASAVLREELQGSEATRLLAAFVGQDSAHDWIRRYPSPAAACRACMIADARRRLKL